MTRAKSAFEPPLVHSLMSDVTGAVQADVGINGSREGGTGGEDRIVELRNDSV